MQEEYLILKDGAAYLGVSRFKLWQLVKAGRLQTYERESDRRFKWVKRSDLDELKRLKPSDTQEAA